MSIPRKQEVVAEAICSALYGMGFTTFLGESDDPETQELMTWFRLGENPTAVVVCVRRHKGGLVTADVTWVNRSGEALLGGSQILSVATNSAVEADLVDPTSNAVVKILEIYRDVIEGIGVAGPLEALAPERAPEADVEDSAVEEK